jgi:hypothetical protein
MYRLVSRLFKESNVNSRLNYLRPPEPEEELRLDPDEDPPLDPDELRLDPPDEDPLLLDGL